MRLLTFCLFAGLCLAGFAQNIVYPILSSGTPVFRSLSEAEKGNINSSFAIGGVIALIGAGVLLESWRKGIVMRLGLTILAVGALAFAISKAFWHFAASFLVIGIGWAFIQTSVNTLVTNVHEDSKGRALNLLHLMYVLGASSAGWIGSIAAAGMWRLPFLILAVLALGIVILTANLKVRETSESANISELKVIFRDRNFILCLLGLFCYGAAEIGIASSVVFYLNQNVGLPLGIPGAGLALSAYWGMMLPGRIIAASYVERLGYRNVILISGFLSGITLIAAVSLSSNLVSACLGFGLLGLLMGPIYPTLLANGMSVMPRLRGIVSGTLVAAAYGGAILSPSLIGWVAETKNWGVGLSLLSGFLFLMCLTHLLQLKIKRWLPKGTMTHEHLSWHHVPPGSRAAPPPPPPRTPSPPPP